MPENTLSGADSFLTAELLKLALESSGVAVWRMDPRTGEIEWTIACKRIFGVPLDQHVDYDFFLACLHPDDRAPTDAAVQQAFDRTGSGSYDVEYRAILPEGGIRWISARGRAFFTGEGDARKAAQFIGTVRDITERKTTEASLQAALEQQQMLLKEVNHRVKNSLQLASSLLRLQARQNPNPELKGQLEDAITRLSTIAHVHQRLYRDSDIASIDFGTFLAELCADLQTNAPHCSISVDSPKLRVPTDRAISLALATNELVTNAFKYAYPGGRGAVSVSVGQPDPGAIAIRVSDQGIGLPPGFSLDGARSLGMVLIAGLLSQLDGTIEIVPAARGATFILSAPL
jgi:PAS domain S-box-containing protein